jgi:predicted MFS family arabinose efflux permease
VTALRPQPLTRTEGGPALPPYAVVWLVFVFAWAASFVVRVGFGALLPPIIAELHLSYTRAGLVASAFFWSYVAMQIPAGLLGDRFGRRRILLLGLLGGTLATASTGLAWSFAALLAARTLTGASQGALFSNDRAIIVAVTPRDRLSLGQGVSFAGPGVGITVGLLLGGALAEHLAWRTIVLLFALGPLAAAALVYRFVPAIPPAPPRAVGTRLAAVGANPRLWVLAAIGFCTIYVQFVLATWAPLFFTEMGVADLARAGALASVQGLAASAGMIAGGVADDRLSRRRGGHAAVIAMGLGSLAVAMAVMALVVGGRSPLALAATLLVAAFFCWSIWSAVYALLGETVRPGDLATAFGCCNSLCFLGAVAGPWLTGLTRDLTGSFATGCGVAAAVAAMGGALSLVVRGSAPPERPPASAGG